MRVSGGGSCKYGKALWYSTKPGIEREMGGPGKPLPHKPREPKILHSNPVFAVAMRICPSRLEDRIYFT